MLAQLQLGNLAAALAVTATRPKLPYPTAEPTRRLLEGLAPLKLRRVDEGVRAFGEAFTAEALLESRTGTLPRHKPGRLR